jgi:hypothetical protein
MLASRIPLLFLAQLMASLCTTSRSNHELNLTDHAHILTQAKKMAVAARRKTLSNKREKTLKSGSVSSRLVVVALVYHQSKQP